ncbi:hypothetical protein T11_14543 [Trichinella zimbabwensis]|uniref:Uncharacterized protein n=1 Tax=Trichinella zimbabwensis TaxID=268475 RepID=A0A0V1G7U2_9BILA|nr:hypothetical protein T11_14543 [Trichinella zimbabwensis]
MVPHNSQLDKEKASLNEVKTYFVYERIVSNCLKKFNNYHRSL